MRPAQRLLDHEIAEDLDARDVAQLLRIDEIGVERRHLALGEHAHQIRGLPDDVVRQDADAEAALDRPLDARDIADRQRRRSADCAHRARAKAARSSRGGRAGRRRRRRRCDANRAPRASSGAPRRFT